MIDTLVPTDSAWFRFGVTVVLMFAPTICFLVGYRLLDRMQHDGLVERMIDEGYEPPTARDFLAQLSFSNRNSNDSTVVCRSCNAPTLATAESCHLCKNRL